MRPLGTMLILALAVPPGGAAPIPRADWIVHGGPVLTLDPERPRVEAAAFAGGVVLALGALDDVLELRGPRTRELDLNGRALKVNEANPRPQSGNRSGGNSYRRSY